MSQKFTDRAAEIKMRGASQSKEESKTGKKVTFKDSTIAESSSSDDESMS